MTPTDAREFPLIFDGHEDFITQIRDSAEGWPPGKRHDRDFLEESDKGHVDLPRAAKGGLGGCFTSIYLTDEQAAANALHFTLSQMDDVFSIADRSGGRFRVCRTVPEIRRAFGDGAFASVFMFEGADAISWRLQELRVFYEAGLRCLAPTWSRSTIFGHGVSFAGNLPSTGLTDKGRELVHECDRLGIILDVSHLNPAGFWDLLGESRHPVLATHSSVKALSPHVRNLDDDQIRAIANKGGTIGINFATLFLHPECDWSADVSIDQVVAHFEHVVNLVGDEHVSFGTDFDGASVPEGVKDAAGLPAVLRAFKQRGWSDGRLERVCHGNFLRVAGEVWR